MSRPPTPCEKNFRIAAPDDLYKELLALLDLKYRKAFKHTQGKDFRQGAGEVLLPHYRRGLIESELEALAHKLGLPAQIVHFEGNNDDFVMITMPGGVELIVCYVKSKDALVRYARKREELTRQSNMAYLDMLEFVPSNLVLAPTAVFCILTHSPDPKDLSRLGEANVIFPSPDPHYSLGSLNLHQEAERVNRERAAAELQVKRRIEVKLKKGGEGS